jgi:hypothetical protein
MNLIFYVCGFQSWKVKALVRRSQEEREQYLLVVRNTFTSEAKDMSSIISMLRSKGLTY